MAATGVLTAGCRSAAGPVHPAAPAPAGPPGAENELDRRNGFRGLPFGSDLSGARKFLTYLSHKDRWQYFTRRGEEMRLGKAELQAVYYSFYRSRLAQVTIIAKGPANSAAVLAWLGENYGPGTAAGTGGRKTVWRGARTGAIFEVRPGTDVAVVSLYSPAHLPR